MTSLLGLFLKISVLQFYRFETVVGLIRCQFKRNDQSGGLMLRQPCWDAIKMEADLKMWQEDGGCRILFFFFFPEECCCDAVRLPKTSTSGLGLLCFCKSDGSPSVSASDHRAFWRTRGTTPSCQPSRSLGAGSVSAQLLIKKATDGWQDQIPPFSKYLNII